MAVLSSPRKKHFSLVSLDITSYDDAANSLSWFHHPTNPPSRPPPVLSMPAINEEMAGVAPTTLPHSNLLSLPISWRAHLNEGYDFSHKALSEKCIYL